MQNRTILGTSNRAVDETVAETVAETVDETVDRAVNRTPKRPTKGAMAKASMTLLAIANMSLLLSSASTGAKAQKKKIVAHKSTTVAASKKPSVPAEQRPPDAVNTPNSVAKPALHVFSDEKHTLYWPIDLPFWVRLATGPEDGSKSFLLKKFSSAPSSEPASDNSKDAIKLEISGSQFVRWMNYVSKDEVKYRFIADSSAPVVTYKFMNAPLFSAGGKSFYGRGLTTTVVAKDEHAGVESKYLAVNELPFSTTTESVPLAEERIYKLRSYAVDHVGYISDFAETQLQVDLTPPKSMTSNLGVFKGNILSPHAKIAIASTDSLSGVKDIHFKMDGEASFKIYDPALPISLETLADGQHVLNYYAVDQVDNREEPQKYEFTLNATAPSMAHTFIGPHFLSKDSNFISAKTQVKIDANSQVAVKDLQFRVGSGDTQKYKGPFLPNIKQGEETLSYESTDELGNASARRSLRIVMDVSAPTTSYTVQGPSFSKDKGGVVYVAEKSKIILSAVDQLSGVKKISYQVNDLPTETYKGAFNVGKDGRFLLRYWATDLVDNDEAIATILMIGDSTAPEIVTVFSQDPVKVSKDNISTFRPGMALTIDSIDNASGVAGIWVNIQGKGETEYKTPIVFSKAGQYKIDVKVMDHVGNVSKKSVALEVAGEGWLPVAH